MRTRPSEESKGPQSRSGATLVGCLVKIVVAGVAGTLIVCAVIYFIFFSNIFIGQEIILYRRISNK